VKPLTKYSALVYFDHFNDDRSVYLADEADAVIADLNGHAEVWSAVAAVRAKRIAELEAERDAARAEVTALQFRVDQQRILAGFGDTDLRLAREQRDTAYRILRRIAGFKLEQFNGPHDMALTCVEEAREMFPNDDEDDTHG